MIVSFDYDTHVLCELTSDQEELRKAIKRAEDPDPIGTTLRNAIIRPFYVVQGHHRQKGNDSPHRWARRRQPRLGPRPAPGQRLQQTDTLVYTIQFRVDEKLRIERMLKTGRIDGGRRRLLGDGEKQEQRRAHQQELNFRAQDFLQRLSLSTAGHLSCK